MKGGALTKVELWSRSSGDDRRRQISVQEELWSRSAGGDEALLKMEL